MTRNQLEAIKTAAVAEGLHRAISSALWDARRATEEAEKNNYKTFSREIAKARERIDDAEQMYREMKK